MVRSRQPRGTCTTRSRTGSHVLTVPATLPPNRQSDTYPCALTYEAALLLLVIGHKGSVTTCVAWMWDHNQPFSCKFYIKRPLVALKVCEIRLSLKVLPPNNKAERHLTKYIHVFLFVFTSMTHVWLGTNRTVQCNSTTTLFKGNKKQVSFRMKTSRFFIHKKEKYELYANHNCSTYQWAFKGTLSLCSGWFSNLRDSLLRTHFHS